MLQAITNSFKKRQIQAAETATALAEREATYQAALKLVARIDEDLTRSIRHYRNKSGQLLTTLDEVIRAILMVEEGFSQKDIADQTGLSTSTIQKCLAALDLEEEIQPDKAHHVNGNGTQYAEARAQAVARSERAKETRTKNKQAARTGLERESAERINAAATKILCPGCSLIGMGDKCALCPGPMEFMAHLGELVEAALVEAEPVGCNGQ